MNTVLSLSVRLWLALQWARRHANRLLALGITAAITPLAQADDDIAGMVNKVTTGVDSTKDGMLKAFIVVGIVLVAGGVIGLTQTKKNPQIKASYCWGCIILGAILVGLDQLIKKSQTQMDMNAVDVG
jgi:hypothetical protein